MARNIEIRTLAERDDGTFKPLVFESDHLAALLADDVMVVVAAWVDPLVACGVAAELE